MAKRKLSKDAAPKIRAAPKSALSDSAQLLEAMFENLGVAILLLDDRRHCTKMNLAAATLTGFSIDEVHGLPLDQFIRPIKAEGQSIRIDDWPFKGEAPAGGRTNGEAMLVRKNGRLLPIAFTATELRDRHSATLGIIVEARDMIEDRKARGALRKLNETLEQQVAQRTSELLKAQESLRHSQKMDALGQLTGGLAHDFNNLLTIVRSAADMLRLPSLSEAKRGRYVQAIADTADRASRLTAQLLAFARRQPLKPEIFDACDRCGQVSEMVRTLVGSHFTVQLATPKEDCWVEADISQFETALINLAVNARDALASNGTISIRVARRKRLPPIRGNPASKGEFIAISVSDTGAGIAPENIIQIFEPFFSTKSVGKGTGLGLSQVYGFAKQSGGDVDVASEIGRGSSFTLYLPALKHRRARIELARPTALPPQEPNRILIVEDNIDVGHSTLEALRELGHDVSLVTHADAALSLLKTQEKSFDVIVTDVIMPGLSGMELAEIVSSQYPEIRMVLTSGYNTVLAEHRTGKFELLKKPYSIEELLIVLYGAALDNRAGPSAAETPPVLDGP